MKQKKVKQRNKQTKQEKKREEKKEEISYLRKREEKTNQKRIFVLLYNGRAHMSGVVTSVETLQNKQRDLLIFMKFKNKIE